MSDVSVLLTEAARDLPEKELWGRVCAAHTRRRHALDHLQHAIHQHGRNLNEDEHNALMSALHGLRLEDDGAVENEVSAYLAVAAERKLKEGSS